MRRIATLLIDNRILVLLVAAALTVAAGFGVMRLRFDDQPRRIFQADNAAFHDLSDLFDAFGTDDAECLVVVRAEDVFSPQAIRFIRGLTEQARAVEGVAGVRSMLDIPVFGRATTPQSLVPEGPLAEQTLETARRRAFDNVLIEGRLVSPDASAALVLVTLRESIDEVREIGPIVEALQAIIEREESAHPGVSAAITGIPPLRVEIIESVRQDQRTFLFIGAALGIAIAWLVFRHMAAVLIVAGVPVIGAGWTMGLMGWVGEPVNVINAVLPTLVLVIGFTDSVHLMVDLRRSRAAGLDGREASIDAIRHLGVACGLTSLTTFVGFSSLAAASIDTVQRFGVASAVGVLIMFSAVITLIPVLTSLVSTQRLVDPQRSHRLDVTSRRWAALIEPVLRRPGLVALAGVLITAGLAVSATDLRPDNRLAESVPRGRPSTEALRAADELFGGILPVFVTIEYPDGLTLSAPEVLEALDRVHGILDAEPVMNAPLSVRTILRALPGSDENLSAKTPMLALVGDERLRRLARPDLHQLVVTARVQDVGAAALEPAFDSVDAKLEKLEEGMPGFDFELTGTTVVAGRNVQLMIADLARSLGLAAIVIFVVLSVAFRSIRIGLVSIVPNAFPLVMTAGLLVALGKPLQITSVIVFSVCLGIAVDDTIHFITRFRREMAVDGTTVLQATRRSFIAVGSALLITTAVLLAGFGASTFSEVPAIRMFSALSCFAIASALLGDLFILPALLMCFVRR